MFAVILLMVILVGALSIVIEAIADSGGTGIGLVVRVVVGILTAPISALAAAVLYFQLRGPVAVQAPVGQAPAGQAPAGQAPPDTTPPDTTPPGLP